ncbi:WD40 repeat-like protein [Gloeopeniophorella convolvens]|nr:WD40 repeat-like protein [Gloeopeniophorella convolvens]
MVDQPINVAKNHAGDEFLRSEAELKIGLARKEKAERLKDVGDPISLPGVPIDLKVRGNYAWVASSTHTVRKIDLETGKTVQVYKGHTGPVTSLAFCDRVPGSGDDKLLITGAWDTTIKVWDTDTKDLISSTPAHADFVKTLLVVPSLNLLVSGSSDKSVRFWDLSAAHQRDTALPPAGSISAHTRPVEALAAYLDPANPAALVLFTADTMGAIKVWDVARDSTAGARPIWRSTPRTELPRHRTGVTELAYGDGHLWSASADETLQLHAHPAPQEQEQEQERPYPPLAHTIAFRAVLPLYLHPTLDADAFPYVLGGAGDAIRVYDVSELRAAELVRVVDAHWHDVTHLRAWLRGREVWVVSGSLDGTLRRWRLAELVAPAPPVVEGQAPAPAPPEKVVVAPGGPAALTEEEERELAELMGDD